MGIICVKQQGTQVYVSVIGLNLKRKELKVGKKET